MLFRSDDNRIENLELSTQAAHSKDHSQGYKVGYQKGVYDGRSNQIEELKKQNTQLLQEMRLLQLQIKERIGGTL